MRTDVKLFYSPSYSVAEYDFDTTRKARWVADSLLAEPIANVELIEPEPVTAAQLCDVHDSVYVAAVQSGKPEHVAQSQGFEWGPLLWPMVCASTGGVLAAARAALQEGVAGSLSSGLHHAKRDRGDGFCTFNGLALTARDALTQGARSILVLDFDAHCGGGTHSLITDDPRIRHADVAVSLFDTYAPTGQNRLEVVEEASQYLPTIRDVLAELEWGQDYDLCLYNAGMDPYEGCSIGGLAGVTRAMLEEREQMVFEWCHAHNVPVAFVLAGGYVSSRLSREELVALHRMSIEAATSIHAGARMPFMRFTFTPMTESDARAILAWRYDAPFDVYNMGDGDDPATALMELLDPRSPYVAARDERGDLVGFFAFGTSAEVGGDTPAPALFSGDGVLSVGLGLRPDLTGQRRGVGLAFVQAGLDFARARFRPSHFRLFVLAFNTRAIRVYERAGFHHAGVVHVSNRYGQHDFVEMRRDAT